ncbi:cation:proton antiporter [Desulfofundulus salinus]|uniref:Cation:proton antiporter n=1 Tax=Desulfofundulus salinus TaxID=2419843 RepID=A0A494X250_9FIRM|nr:cation:proton antiporter [Desulfofundulus salinum]RKO67225.1 cation:proton antiporter [Desulfofundulus salinum]
MPFETTTNLTIIFFLITLAVLLANKLHFSSIPLLILLGILFGPYGPHNEWFDLRLVQNCELVSFLSHLGVLLLLFYLGLEFSASRVVQNGPTILKGGTVYVGLNFLRGLILGWVFFHSLPETLIVAGITTISSSAMVTKLLMELKRTANPETELVLGFMVYEDAFMAVYLSLLYTYFLTGGTSFTSGLLSGLVTLLFILAVLFSGPRFSPYLERWLHIRSGESFIAIGFTLLLFTVLVAEKLHVAEAVGALLLGLILAETSHARRLVQMIAPMRDLFGAVFFFAFGMGIDYREFSVVAGITAVAVLATVFGNLFTGWFSAWICGYRGRSALNVASIMIPRGELAILVAGIAASAQLTAAFQPFAALYVLALALVSPPLAKKSGRIHNIVTNIWSSLRPAKQSSKAS